MNQEELFINGELLRLRREARGWVLNDMATRACMSVKQIRQLEEGGISAFYSEAVKATSAKKVGSLLGLTADEVLAPTVVQEASPETVASADLIEELQAESEPAVAIVNEVFPASKLHNEAATPAHSQADVAQTQPHAETPAVSTDSAPVEDASKSKASLGVIAVLFVAALAVAAYLQPKEDTSVEAAPPIQVLPADAASAADGVASEADGVALPASATSTVSPAVTAPVTAPIASAPRVTVPVASAPAAPTAPVAVRPASAALVSAPAASAASKAP